MTRARSASFCGVFPARRSASSCLQSDSETSTVLGGLGMPNCTRLHPIKTWDFSNSTLGTPYPEVAQRIGEIVDRVAKMRREEYPTLYVDATGVGTPVVDLLRASATQASEVIAVYFTHGDRRTVEAYEVKLGKAYLVSRLQSLLQTGRLHLPRTSESEALSEELLNYEIRVDSNANDRYGAFKVGTHDDLVTALGLALQVDVDTGPICW